MPACCCPAGIDSLCREFRANGGGAREAPEAVGGSFRAGGKLPCPAATCATGADSRGCAYPRGLHTRSVFASCPFLSLSLCIFIYLFIFPPRLIRPYTSNNAIPTFFLCRSGPDGIELRIFEFSRGDHMGRRVTLVQWWNIKMRM